MPELFIVPLQCDNSLNHDRKQSIMIKKETAWVFLVVGANKSRIASRRPKLALTASFTIIGFRGVEVMMLSYKRRWRNEKRSNSCRINPKASGRKKI
jgi:hypothetical protein